MKAKSTHTFLLPTAAVIVQVTENGSYTKRMPRTETTEYRKHFKPKEEDEKRMVCQIQIEITETSPSNSKDDRKRKMKTKTIRCGYETTNHNTNLKRHIEERHNNIFKEVEAQKKSRIGKITSNQQSLDNFFDLRHQVRVSCQLVLLSILKWVTVDGRPLELINDAGFKFVKDILKQIPNSPTVNKENIRRWIRQAADTVRAKITETFKGNYLSVKLDGGQYHGRKFLGIMAQCRNLMNIQEFNWFTLGCIEIKEKQTAENIKKKLIEVLGTFGIKETQIFSCTTDGARNYLNVAKLFKKPSAQEPQKEKENDEDVCGSDDEFEFEDPEIEEFVISNDEEEDELQVRFNIEEFKRLRLDSLQLIDVIRIRCLAHLLQLSVQDFMDTIPLSYSTALETARETILACRKFNIKTALKKENCGYLSLDVSTRWNSTYDMIDRFIKNQDVIERCSHLFKDYSMTSKAWSKIKALRTVLKECYELTVALSRTDIVPTDAFIKWMEARYKIRQKADEIPHLCTQLDNAMKKREPECFGTNDFCVMRFLDPRLRDGLSKSERDKAMKTIYELYFRLFGESDPEAEAEKTSTDTSKNKDGAETSESISFDDFLFSSKETKCTPIVEDDRNTLESELMGYVTENRRKAEENVLTFWTDKKKVYERLYKISTLYFQIPMTEVSVERLFSHVKFILDPLRVCLSAELLNEIMLVRMNIHLFEGAQLPCIFS